MKTHVTVIPSDGIISVDGEVLFLDGITSETFHALQWHDGAGHSEDVAVDLSGSTGATTLTIAQMPNHSHSFTAVISAKGRYMESGNIYESGRSNTSAVGGNGSHTHPLSGPVSGTHTDPHLAMNYFIKVV